MGGPSSFVLKEIVEAGWKSVIIAYTDIIILGEIHISDSGCHAQ
jgi:hypothetical protein